ncbi:MAG TPA: O-antigen ligase family protein [Gemmatimonadales bacterium]|nr:O-antigen ligase family protein [Gemmatimonadales bacterium]
MRQRLMRRGGSGAVAAGAVAPGQPMPYPGMAQGARPSAILRWALYGFIFSLPFDAPGRLPLELTTMTGALFLAVCILQPGLCFGRRPSVTWWFLGYLYVYWAAYVAGGAQFTGDAVRSSLFYIQALLIFIACFNLMRDPKIARHVMIVLAVAALVLALMTILGIETAKDTDSQRVTVFGQNANRAARVLLAGALACVGLVVGRPQRALRPAWIAWPAFALIVLAMIMGGSRGGLVAFAAGLWMFSMTGRSIGIRIRNIGLTLLLLGGAAFAAWKSPLMQQRLQLAAGGNLAQRQVIFPVAFGEFKSRPLIGYGPANQYVLAVRLGLPPRLHQTRDTHNLFLEVLTATGVLGTVPFLWALWVCCWSAWKARRGIEGILPAAQMMSTMVGNLTGNYIVLKLQWVLFAYAMASWIYLTPRPQPSVGPTPAARRRARMG